MSAVDTNVLARVVTHPRLFRPPTTVAGALEVVARVVQSPSVRLLCPTERYPTLFADIARDAGASGDLAFDAQIAAVCREHGVRRLLTADRDFARFSSIEIEPLER